MEIDTPHLHWIQGQKVEGAGARAKPFFLNRHVTLVVDRLFVFLKCPWLTVK